MERRRTEAANSADLDQLTDEERDLFWAEFEQDLKQVEEESGVGRKPSHI